MHQSAYHAIHMVLTGTVQCHSKQAGTVCLFTRPQFLSVWQVSHHEQVATHLHQLLFLCCKRVHVSGRNIYALLLCIGGKQGRTHTCCARRMAYLSRNTVGSVKFDGTGRIGKSCVQCRGCCVTQSLQCHTIHPSIPCSIASRRGRWSARRERKPGGG